MFSVSSKSANSLARLSSFVSSSSTAVAALPSLPAAFNRGAIEKAIVDVFKGLSKTPATSIIARIPILFGLCKIFKPLSTITLFSPKSGTTSAIVPRVAISTYWLNTSVVLSPFLIARAKISLKATPTPASASNG